MSRGMRDVHVTGRIPGESEPVDVAAVLERIKKGVWGSSQRESLLIACVEQLRAELENAEYPACEFCEARYIDDGYGGQQGAAMMVCPICERERHGVVVAELKAQVDQLQAELDNQNTTTHALNSAAQVRKLQAELDKALSFGCKEHQGKRQDNCQFCETARICSAAQDMALRFAEDRDKKKHENRELTSKVEQFQAENTRLLEGVDTELAANTELAEKVEQLQAQLKVAGESATKFLSDYHQVKTEREQLQAERDNWKYHADLAAKDAVKLRSAVEQLQAERDALVLQIKAMPSASRCIHDWVICELTDGVKQHTCSKCQLVIDEQPEDVKT